MPIFGTTDIRYLRSDTADNRYRCPILQIVHLQIRHIGYQSTVALSSPIVLITANMSMSDINISLTLMVNLRRLKAIPWPWCRLFQAAAFYGQHGDPLHRRHTDDIRTPCTCRKTSTTVHPNDRCSRKVDWRRHLLLCRYRWWSECNVEPEHRAGDETCQGTMRSRQHCTVHRTM